MSETFVSEVDSENYDIWVELSGEEVNTFLSEFGFGVFCELEVAAEEPEEPEEPGSIWDEEPWKKQNSWQDAVPVAELSSEEIAFDYRSFHFLCGMGVDEFQEATKRELEFLEYWSDSTVYTDSGDNRYYFLTEQDAFYAMEYDAPDADAALSLAQNCYEEIYALYDENEYAYPVEWAIHEIESVEELDNNVFKKTYKESWPVLYNGRMEEKVKDYLSTDKVQLSLYIHTPVYQQQGFYTVGISQVSTPLDILNAK